MKIQIETKDTKVQEELHYLFGEKTSISSDLIDIYNTLLSGKECFYVFDMRELSGITASRKSDILEREERLQKDGSYNTVFLKKVGLHNIPPVEFKPYEVAHFRRIDSSDDLKSPRASTQRDYRKDLVNLSTMNSATASQAINRFQNNAERVMNFMTSELEKVAMMHFFLQGRDPMDFKIQVVFD